MHQPIRPGRLSVEKELLPALEKLAEITDLEERFDAIRNTDFRTVTPEETYWGMAKALIYMPPEVTMSRPYNIDRFPFYRARVNLNEDTENVSLCRTFSYPNPVHCTSNGRANLVRRPVFYASDHPGTAVAEISPEDGDIVYLGEWMICCHRATMDLSILPPMPEKTNQWTTIARNLHKGRTDFYRTKFGDHLADKVSRIFEFLAHLFTDEPPPYTRSSAYANHFLYEIFGLDYILYPSVKTSAHSCNLAFHPNFIDEFGRLDKVYKMKIHRAHKQYAALEVLSVAEYMLNNLMWRAPSEEDMAFLPLQFPQDETPPNA